MYGKHGSESIKPTALRTRQRGGTRRAGGSATEIGFVRVRRCLRYLYLACCSQPAWERCLYKQMRCRPIARVLEVGMGDGRRARRLIELARAWRPTQPFDYTIIDPFELVPGGLSIKAAHQMLARTGARYRLIPGDPLGALAATANTLLGQQLVIITIPVEPEARAALWFYVPRLLADDALVYLADASGPGGTCVLRPVSREEVLARAAAARRRAA